MHTRRIKIGNQYFNVVSDDTYLSDVGETFEPHMVDLFRALIDRDDVVADIGANIGLTALLFSTIAAQTYAFEPSPSTFNLLKQNLHNNNVRNVDAFNLGFGPNTQQMTITFATNNRSGGFVSEKIRPETHHTTESIQIEPIDTFFKSTHPAPNFFKIDVEGFEKHVIQGGREFLQRHQPIILMEMNHFCLDVLQRITVPDFIDYMKSVFPILFAIDSDNSAVVDLFDKEKAYFVMHEHVVKHRFPNIVGGFKDELIHKLSKLVEKEPHTTTTSKNIRSRDHNLLNAALDATSVTTPTAQAAGGIKLISKLSHLLTGENYEIEVQIQNAGATPWYGYGKNPVLLSYHWLFEDGTTHEYDGTRTALPSRRLGALETTDATMKISSPQIPGNYLLVLTLVQEGIFWFEDRGFVNEIVRIQASNSSA